MTTKIAVSQSELRTQAREILATALREGTNGIAVEHAFRVLQLPVWPEEDTPSVGETVGTSSRFDLDI